MVLTEKEIKQSVLHDFANKENNYIAVPEVSISDSICDIFLINGSIHIFEIKSCRDNLNRIYSQINNYIAYSNYTTLVVGSNFYQKYNEKLIQLNKTYGIGLRKILDHQKIEIIYNAKEREVSHEKYLDYWKISDLKKLFSGSKKSYSLTKDIAIRTLSLFCKKDLKDATLHMLKDKYAEQHSQIVNQKKIAHRNIEQTNRYKLSVNYTKSLKEMKSKIYVPFITLTKQINTFFEDVHSNNIVPYLHINIKKSKEILEAYNKTKKLTKRHFISILKEDNNLELIKLKKHAIPAIELRGDSLKDVKKTIISAKRKHNEIAFMLYPTNNGFSKVIDFMDYLPEDKKYHIILNYKYSNNVSIDDIQANIETITTEVKLKNIYITIMGSSMPNSYYDTIPKDNIMRDHEHAFYIKYKQIIADSSYYTISFGDYCGYEEGSPMEAAAGMNFHRIAPRAFLIEPKDPFNMKVIRVNNSHQSKLPEILSIIQSSNLLEKKHCEGCNYFIEKKSINFAMLKQHSMLHNIAVMSEEIAKETSKLT